MKYFILLMKTYKQSVTLTDYIMTNECHNSISKLLNFVSLCLITNAPPPPLPTPPHTLNRYMFIKRSRTKL